MQLSKNATVILYPQPVRLQKGFDALLSLVLNELKMELIPNTYVLFINSERNRFKMLFFEKNNIAIFTMRLPGVMQVKFGNKIELTHKTFYDLITQVKSRKMKSRYGLIRTDF